MKVEFLDRKDWKRGPGGNWYCYRVVDEDHNVGYGQTELEARRDLKSKMEKRDGSP